MVRRYKTKTPGGKTIPETDYRVHCAEERSPCKDHCRKFALSDPVEKDFKEDCDHEHHLRCNMCEDLNDVMNDVKEKILGSSASMYSKEYQEDLLHDFEQAKTDILLWKAHILRSENQDRAKLDIIIDLNDSSVLVVMDWAMKFLQIEYREKQSEWFGKRGISWHVSTVIFKQAECNDVEVQTYAHLLDNCQQDWFAACSIFENLMKNVLTSRPSINCVFLRSDEAGCYHNNAFIASLKEVGQGLGVFVKGYHYSEPAYGKDVCDRILYPMKSSIHCYCNEGHDINSAADMRTALLERPVRGVTASVCVIDEKKKNLKVNKIDGFSKLHNFTYEEKGLRVWKAYDIGSGKLISLDNIAVNKQDATGLIVQENRDLRNARDEENNRRFSIEEWLTKSQIKSYFSRLASARRKGQETEEVDDQTEIEDIFEEEEEDSRQQVISSIIEEIGLRHPICYDVYDLCDYYKCSKLSKFNSHSEEF